MLRKILKFFCKSSTCSCKCGCSNGSFSVDNVFRIESKGVVVIGKVLEGGLCVGMETNKQGKAYHIKEMEVYHKQKTCIKQGEEAGLLLDTRDKDVFVKGDVLQFKKA